MTFQDSLNKKTMKYILLLLLSIGYAVMFLFASLNASAADSIFTEYQPTITQVVDASGFKHPGVGLTKGDLENVRAQVRAGKEPWNTYFNAMLTSSAAATTVTSSNRSSVDITLPASDAFNSQGFNSRFISDGLKAYTQALLYVITGNEVYRSNALQIIRIWSKMDPAKYVYFNDAHIHTGIPLNRMVNAAEILRYTSTQNSALEWTAADTTSFTNNLIVPATETFSYKNDYFMNQHQYPLIGALSGYIFTNNKTRYDEGVEWFTVNKTAVDQGQNGAIKQLFRLVDTDITTGDAVSPPRVQHVEMGRDQAHGAGDITNAALLARLLNAQGTKVDPVVGTISAAQNAVGAYEFLGNRILSAADYFAQFMIGYQIPWTPVASHTDAYGNPTIIYKELSQQYRGRLTQNTWESYYYYKYKAGINVEAAAPNLVQMFAQRVSYNWDGVDGGGDFWLLIPAAAEVEGARYLVRVIKDSALREVEDRYTAFDNNTSIVQEGDISFVRVNTTLAGSKIAIVGSGAGSKTVAFRIRTNGVAALELGRVSNVTETGSSGKASEILSLPDTKGQWRYIGLTLDQYQGFSDLVYLTFKGSATTVDVDNVNIDAASSLTPPAFTQGNSALNVNTYSGSAVPVSFDFSAVDTQAITYQVDNLPNGATFNTSTAAFSWQPTQAGTYVFVVSASDGTSVTTRQVTLIVSADRQAAVNAIIAPYNPNVSYVSAGFDNYTHVYTEVMSLISTASDAIFSQKLSDLTTAVAGLQQLTPLLGDGSMDFSRMFVDSTFGTGVPYILDNYSGSWAGGNAALTHIMDFGPDFKVSTTAFWLQVRASFPERLSGTTFFGSNDKENWTRITPGMTGVVDDMQRLDVQTDLRSKQYRFIKMQAIAPASNIFELAELRIFGERHQTVNRISSVSLASAKNLKNRVVAGDTITVSFKTTEAITNVSANIQGLPATISTVDNLNWTATLAVDAAVPAGTVKFVINYKTAGGVDAEPTLFTTDYTTLFIADESQLIGDILNVASVIDSSGRSQGDLLPVAGWLFDGDLGTVTDFRVNGSGYGGFIVFDFKEGGQATLSKVEVISRQDGYYTRINGTVIQGSNDNVTWTTISTTAWATTEWQTLTINGTTPYRYIRAVNGNNWYGNMAELRLHGKVESFNKIATASIGSTKSLNNRIVPGDVVTLGFTAKEAVSNVNVTIQGQAATVSTTDNIHFTATVTLSKDVAVGLVSTRITYRNQDGTEGFPNTSITDGTSLYIVSETDVIGNMTTITDLIDSTSGRTAAATLAMANLLFDSSASGITDFRNGSAGSGAGSYIAFDFRGGNEVKLTNVELLARQDGYSSRINGAVIQGSYDNATWTTISNVAVSTTAWQNLTISDTQSYRYIRIYNANAWYGNMIEARFHGAVKSLNRIASASIVSAQSLKNRIVPGNTVTLSFTAKEAINAVNVYIQGQTATVSTTDNINFKVTATLAQSVVAGKVKFAIDYNMQDGSIGYPMESTTDSSSLYVVDESDVITVVDVATLVDSTPSRTAATTLTNVKALFDSNMSTASDFRGTGGSGSGGYITFDFNAGNAVSIGSVELLARQDQVARIKYAVVQGSNDNSTWVTLTDAAAATADWQILPSKDAATAYRYIRVWNNSSWYGNMAELRLHRNVLDVTSPATATFAADKTEPTNTDVSVTISYPTDTILREYKVGNGPSWAAYTSPVVVSENSIVYARGTDAAGNASDISSYTVSNIDKVVPTATVVYSALTQADQPVIAEITTSEPVTITNNGGSSQYTFIYNGSFVFEFVDAAGNKGSVTTTVNNFVELSSGVPAIPFLFYNNVDYLQDGNYEIVMNTWFGNSGRVYKLYENDVLIETKILADNAPLGQTAVSSFTNKLNGTYRYYAELTNKYGTTRSATYTVSITQASPAKPLLSNDNWDGDGNFNIYMNMWWGTNGKTYNLYENDVLIYTQALTSNSPSAQSAVAPIAKTSVGTYHYRAELVNYAGATSSEIINVAVTH